MYKKQEVGKFGEELATKYLQSLGYKIIDRNFACKQGEIDIIAHTQDELIFVEVKTRASLLYGNPVDAVTKIKQKHIEEAAKYYIYKKGLEYEYIRFDIIEVYIYKEKYKINHIRQVV